jgi:hypothetical protein
MMMSKNVIEELMDVTEELEVQNNIYQGFDRLNKERPKVKQNLLRQTLSFPMFVNAVSPYMDGLVSNNASEEK